MPRTKQTRGADDAWADDALLEAMMGIALEAGRIALGLRKRNSPKSFRHDGPIALDACEDARALILEGLAEVAPGTPIYDKSGAAGPASGAGSAFFLVDPADGVDELAAEAKGDARNPQEFTIDIGLVIDGAPVAGVVYAPALEWLWSARPGSAWRARVHAESGVGPSRPIKVRPAPEHGITAVASRSNHSPDVEAFLRAYRAAEHRTAGSSLKFCLLAEGSGDLYPELGRSMAWSTAAGDAVLRAAGGRTVTLDGAPLSYAPPGGPGDRASINPQFVALGSIGLRAPTPA